MHSLAEARLCVEAISCAWQADLLTAKATLAGDFRSMAGAGRKKGLAAMPVGMTRFGIFRIKLREERDSVIAWLDSQADTPVPCLRCNMAFTAASRVARRVVALVVVTRHLAP